MMVPEKMQGALGNGWRLTVVSAFFAVSYQCRGLRFKPYRVFFNSRYVRGGVNGHPFGGVHTYCSSGGSVVWQKA